MWRVVSDAEAFHIRADIITPFLTQIWVPESKLLGVQFWLVSSIFPFSYVKFYKFNSLHSRLAFNFPHFWKKYYILWIILFCAYFKFSLIRSMPSNTQSLQRGLIIPVFHATYMEHACCFSFCKFENNHFICAKFQNKKWEYNLPALHNFWHIIEYFCHRVIRMFLLSSLIQNCSLLRDFCKVTIQCFIKIHLRVQCVHNRLQTDG